jgi:hypothetical protein
LLSLDSSEQLLSLLTALKLGIPLAHTLETSQFPLANSPREPTAEMVGNISRELAEIERAIVLCRGDQTAEARLTGTWMAHLLLCCPELLHNLWGSPDSVDTDQEFTGDTVRAAMHACS